MNLDLLSKNIRLNKLNNKISIFPIPLSNISSSVEFKISDITPGSALSSITSYDQNGKPINEMHSFNTFSTSSDDLIDLFNLPQPDYIKIDVDGIEHLILKGAIKILQNTKSILLETNFNFEDQYLAIDRILKENGFLLHSKFFFNGSTQCNAIWNKV